MKNTGKRIRLLSLIAGIMLAIGAAMVPIQANAAVHGIYVAAATPYYSHPQTGVIEDSGNNSALGQSMIVSATHSQALIEVDQSGNTYATVRLKLMDNISNVSFKVNGSSLGYTVMKEDLGNNTSDFRFKIPSESTIITASFYVTAMGRDVVYFIGFSGLQAGSGDFITSIAVADANANTQQDTSKQDNNTNTEEEKPQEESSEPQEESKEERNVSKLPTAEKLLEEASGIEIYEVKQEEASVAEEATGNTGWIAAIVLAGIALLGGGGFVVYQKFLRGKTDEM